MGIDVPMGCTCGVVRGLVRGVMPANAVRLVCMCDDCQAYAHFLGRAHQILDAHGGTDLSYATQSRIEISTGREQLRAVRLYPRGVLRVYTACCRTPVAHVPSPKLAFVGLVHLCMREGSEGQSRDALLGPIERRFQGRFARGGMPEGAHPGTPVAPQLRALWRVARDSVRGHQRPSPFHDEAAAPSMPTVVLSALERAALSGERGVSAAQPLLRYKTQGCS